MARANDVWARWLEHGRHGGDPAEKRAVLEALAPVRDRVLANARIEPGNTVLDVGAGDGLIGFGALPHLGEHGRVVFSDLSPDLLRVCEEIAVEAGVRPRCEFVENPVEDLRDVADSSVDVVTCRSVLVYVRDKAKALGEIHRVLESGGRFSAFEPINRFEFPGEGETLFGYNVRPIRDVVERFVTGYHAADPDEATDADPMLDFDERDLFRMAHEAGLRDLRLELQASMTEKTSGPERSWEGFLEFAPNPNAPTIGEAISKSLTTEEARRFESYLRPLVETGRKQERHAVAYLWGTKP